MSNLFTVTIPDSATALLVTYGAGAVIRVQSSPTQAGIYGDVATIPVVSGISVYSAYDALGSASDWYQIRYEASDGDPAGLYSTPFQPMPLDGMYASLSDFNIFIRNSAAETADDSLKLLALDAASRAIDRSANRRFEVATGIQTARIFTPSYRTPWPEQLLGRYPYYSGTYSYPRHTMTIDDTLDESATVNFDSTGTRVYDLASTAFRLGPINAASRGRPWNQLVFDSGTFPPFWDESVEVTADWGWDSVPTSITYACLVQASRFFKRRDAPFGVAGSPEMGNELRLLAKLDPDVAVMIASYRKSWGAA